MSVTSLRNSDSLCNGNPGNLPPNNQDDAAIGNPGRLTPAICFNGVEVCSVTFPEIPPPSSSSLATCEIIGCDGTPAGDIAGAVVPSTICNGTLGDGLHSS